MNKSDYDYIVRGVLPKQLQLLKLPAKYILYGGAKGGGKTVGLSMVAMTLLNEYAGNRIAIIRRNLPRLKDTTLKTFLSVAETYPNEYQGKMNNQSLEYRHPNGSEILFRSADPSKDAEYQQFRGLELGAFIIDEASEVEEQVFNELNSCLRLKLKNGKHPPYHGILTSNPHQGWLKRRFIDMKHPDYLFIPALPGDNYTLPKSYIETLKNLPEKLRKLYYEGDWSVADEPDAIVKYEWIVNGAERIQDMFTLDYETEKKLGVDVARFGKDKTIITLISGDTVHKIWTYDQTSTTEVVSKIKTLIYVHKIKPENIAIDEVAVGSGVVDQLRADGFKVKGINVGRRATKKNNIYQYANLKTQFYWSLREAIQSTDLKIPLEFKDTIDDLLAIKWFIRGDRIIAVESKEELKKRINRSPDYSDSLALAFNVGDVKSLAKPKAFLV